MFVFFMYFDVALVCEPVSIGFFLDVFMFSSGRTCGSEGWWRVFECCFGFCYRLI